MWVQSGALENKKKNGMIILIILLLLNDLTTVVEKILVGDQKIIKNTALAKKRVDWNVMKKKNEIF